MSNQIDDPIIELSAEFPDAESSDLNGFFVKDEKGCEWYSLTDDADDLSSEVHSLGISDLHSVTAQLLASQPLSSSEETSLSIVNPMHYPRILSSLDVIHETCESSSLDEEGDGDVETETGAATETAAEDRKSMDECATMTYKYKTPISNFPNLKRLKKPFIASTSESNNSDSSIQSCSYSHGKRRGGWPKGRKRKPSDPLEIKPPKAPSTGYVLYLIEQRKYYSNMNMSFQEVTKKLGNDWSKLSESQKKYYLDKADLDKKRYRDELRQYRKSEAYQRKRSKHRRNRTEESDFDATDEIEDEDESLYCEPCDQWFVTYHNKKEHMYGKQHLGKVGKWKKSAAILHIGKSNKWKQTSRSPVALRKSKTPRTTDNSSSYSLDESSLDAAPPQIMPRLNSNLNVPDLDVSPQPVSYDTNNNIVEVMKMCQERDSELQHLRLRLVESKTLNDQLNKLISSSKTRKKQLTKITASLKDQEQQLHINLSKFWSVVSMFVTLKTDSDT